jgi:glyoxylase-like metal-dependent hydrolase (beta-lactamase superfamily II)
LAAACAKAVATSSSAVAKYPADGTLFSGDVVYDDGALLDSIAGSDRAQYRSSLLRLRSLPIRMVRPGHGPSFGRRRLHAIIDRYLKERP